MRDELDPVANILVRATLETLEQSGSFRDAHDGYPLTAMAKAHLLRNITQFMLHSDDRFELRQPYLEFGRVQFGDATTGVEYLLRSGAALDVALTMNPTLFALDSFTSLTGTTLLIYSPHRHGIDLSVAATKRVSGSTTRLEIAGPPRLVGTWLYDVGSSDGDQTFRETRDGFDDLGGLGEAFGGGGPE